MSVEDQRRVPLFVDKCIAIYPNNQDTQEIIIVVKRLTDGSEVEITFTPDEYLTTFTKDMYDHIRKSYIKYLKEL